MPRLYELISELASAVVLAETADERALADLQGRLRALADAAIGSPDASQTLRATVQKAADNADQLLSRVLNHEAFDAQSAVRTVGEIVQDLQRVVERGDQPQDVHSSLRPTRRDSGKSPPAVAGGATIEADDLPLIRDFVTEAREHLAAAEAGVLRLEQDPQDADAVNVVFRSFHTIKGVAGFLHLGAIGALAHGAEDLLDRARGSLLAVTENVVDQILEAADYTRSMVDALEESARQGVQPPTPPGLADLLERLHSHSAARPEMSRHYNRGNVEVAQSGRPVEPTAGRGAPLDSGASATVRVATSRLDSLVDIVGELVIAQSVLAQDAASAAGAKERLARNLSHLSKVTRELQELSMSLRMVPIEGTFRRMARLTRDLARAAQKEVTFVTSGGGTELDRKLIEAIADPLVHMVRNAIDHGIERPDARERAGKPREGRVELKARQQAGSIIIEVSDDGGGLDKQRIRSKAVDAGVVKEKQELSDQEIFHLIFHPGLSTAERVTDVSGRGVGMDVVRQNVEALRGRIDIASAEGKGSTFALRVPLTLAVVDGLVVGVGSQRYVIPMTSVEHSIRPGEHVSTVQDRGEVCLVRGRVLPLFRLYKLFGIAGAVEDPLKALAVVVEDNGRRCCLLVDELLGQQQVLVKPLGAGIGAVPGVSGAAILGDGGVSLILDPPALMDLACENGLMSKEQTDD